MRIILFPVQYKIFSLHYPDNFPLFLKRIGTPKKAPHAFSFQRKEGKDSWAFLFLTVQLVADAFQYQCLLKHSISGPFKREMKC